MTSRERLTAASRGGPVDQQPVLAWPSGADSDVIVVKPIEVADALDANPDKVVLAEVFSPFSRAIQCRLSLNTLLREDPEKGQEELERLAEVTRQDIDVAILSGADGIFYRLQGAEPAYSTPMEYGGFYLERDRELLAAVDDARLNVLYVEGGPETYLDFVGDLPAHLFAVDLQGQELRTVKELRQGAVAARHADAEVFFVTEAIEVGRGADDLASAHG